MKIAFVSVENSLSTISFRKMAALVKTIEPEVDVCLVMPFNASSPWNRLRAKTYQNDVDGEIDAIASHLARHDMVCLSSMSTHAKYTHHLIQAVRSKNPGAFVVWGGIHCTVDPEDAIRSADAVCIGEGEQAFPEFLGLFKTGRDHTNVRNFYFRRQGQVIRGDLRPLQTNEELGSLPFPLLNEGELLYKPGRGFVPIKPLDYVSREGLAYNTVWSIGCPNRCIYCGNSKFLKNHADYGRLRFPPVDHIIGEVLHARARYPHLSSVTFHDDLFMAIPLPVLEEFAGKWRDRVGLPFAVHGLMSRYVNPPKMKVLVTAGMYRVRMGIQSGSPRTLGFFRRPDSPGSIEAAVRVIQGFSRHIVTPSYDIIVDNPLETSADIADTARLLYRLPRPFILNIFPLMIIPGTELAEIARERGLTLPYIHQGHVSGSLANVLILALCLWKLPQGALERFLKRLSDPAQAARAYPNTVLFLRSALALKRALAHLRFGNLSVVPSGVSWVLWRTGFVRLASRRILRRCASASKT